MRAFVVKEFGQGGVVEERPTPVPGDGEVLVRVRAAAVNAMDTVLVTGAFKDFMEHRLPLIPGLDASGTVAGVGSGLSGFAVGEAVFGTSAKPYFGEGTFAELATMPAVGLVHRPASLDDRGAASLPLVATTALAAADAVEPLAGATVLIVGATGGVGSIATQLAARRGARVIAVTLEEHAAYALDLGASETIDYTTGDLVELVRLRHPGGVDAVIDLAHDAAGITPLLDLLRRGGRVTSALGGVDAEVLAARGLKGSNASGGPARMGEVRALVEQGDVRVPEIRTYRLEEAASAIEEQRGRHVRGKLVLLVD